MKKGLTLLLFFAMGKGFLFAQRGFNVQLALQPGASFLSGDWKAGSDGSGNDYAYKKTFTFGFEGGVNGGYNFTDNMGVSVGLIYALQGQNYKELVVTTSEGDQILNNDISLSYLKIPFRFIYSTNPENSISITGYAGFYLGFLAGYKQTMTFAGTNTFGGMAETDVLKGKTATITTGSGSNSYDLTARPFKTVDFGLTLGAGAQKRLSENLFLFVMLNYQMGFVDVKNKSAQVKLSASDIRDIYRSTDPNTSVNHRNAAFGLTIGVKKCF